MPEKTSELKTALETYLIDIVAHLPKPNPAYDSSLPSTGNDKKGGKKDRKKR